MRNLFVGALIIFALQSAHAEKLYRCGNTFSQVPCGPNEKEVRARSDVLADSAPGGADRAEAMKAACVDWIRNVPAWKDRESVKISGLRRGRFLVHSIDGEPTMVVTYLALVNGKNSYGGYTGEKSFVCYANQQETKIIDGSN